MSAARRDAARARARFGWAVLLLPVVLVVAFDFARRGARLVQLDRPHVGSYVAAIVESAILWGVLLLVAVRRRGPLRWVARAAFVVLATLAIGGQRYFYSQYATYLNLEATRFGLSLPASLLGQIRADLESLLLAEVPPLAVALGVVFAASRTFRPRRRTAHIGRLVVLPALVAPLFIPCSYARLQASTPDVIYFHAIGGAIRALSRGGPPHVRPGLRTPEFVPQMAARPSVPRNVMLIVTESVRFDAACVRREPGCKLTPFTNELAPNRMPLVQMRSNDSTTAISLAVMWSGLRPTETREAIHSAPLIFDFGHAAGYDGAYWTSQNLMFANSHLFVRDLPISHSCGATDLEPAADIDTGAKDALLSARVVRELSELKEPWLAVVHYANTHFPYRIDEHDAPFTPYSTSKHPDDNPAFLNYYRNAVHAQDRAIAEVVRYLRQSAAGARTVIVYTSDHGEAFREHGQLGHTGAIYDEEVRVPTWIDAPPGALSATEVSSILAARDEPTWHIDLAPTILDLMGVWDAPEMARFRTRMIGTSLLRPERTRAIVPMTNCTEIWGCAFRNWGLMRGPMKLEAREWDYDWHCWHVLDDPSEQHDLGARACGDLVGVATSLFGTIPKDSPVIPEKE